MRQVDYFARACQLARTEGAIILKRALLREIEDADLADDEWLRERERAAERERLERRIEDRATYGREGI